MNAREFLDAVGPDDLADLVAALRAVLQVRDAWARTPTDWTLPENFVADIDAALADHLGGAS